MLISVTSLNYGPFSAYAPCYDSTFANITKEQSDLLLTTYGDDVGLEYAKRSVNWMYTVQCVHMRGKWVCTKSIVI